MRINDGFISVLVISMQSPPMAWTILKGNKHIFLGGNPVELFLPPETNLLPFGTELSFFPFHVFSEGA